MACYRITVEVRVWIDQEEEVEEQEPAWDDGLDQVSNTSTGPVEPSAPLDWGPIERAIERGRRSFDRLTERNRRPSD